MIHYGIYFPLTLIFKYNFVKILSLMTFISISISISLKPHILQNKSQMFERSDGTITVLTYWSFPLRFPLILGWSPFCCVTDLMAFLHLDLSLVSAIFSCFLRRSALTTSFHLNFGLPRGVGPSTLKFMIFFVHDVSSCQCK